MKEVNPEDIERVEKEIHERITILKEHAESEEELKKLEKYEAFFASRLSKRNEKKRSRQLNTYNKSLSFYQRFKKALGINIDMDPSRLMGLSDGIFGMVMTLLVFSLSLPELMIADDSTFASFFTTLAPTIAITIISFLLVSSFWIYHHQFIKVKRINFPFLWLNIIFLICISFIPFSTSLIGNYSNLFLSEILFELNILCTIVAFLLLYYYAGKRELLENNPSRKEKWYVQHTFIILIVLTIAVNILDYYTSHKFIYLFLLVPVISTLRDINFRMKL